MLHREPDAEGFEVRCEYCGRLLVDYDLETDIPEHPRAAGADEYLCCEDCARAHRCTPRSGRESETEQMGRSGPT